MDDNTTGVLICAIIFGPIGAYFILRALRGSPRRASAQELAQQAALTATAERMERRIASLEMILDNELPGWRSRSTP